MMEFDELQKIWDTQNGKNLFVLNEEGLHNRIAMKKSKAKHIVNFSELLIILVNLASAVFIAALNLSATKPNVFMYLLAIWMTIIAIVIFIKRRQRMNATKQFDRSMMGDLQQALGDAAWQVRLSQLMRWNIVPIALLSLIGMLQGGKSIGLVVGVLMFFVIAHFASNWEHGLYKSRMRELETLKTKLES